MPQPGIFYRDRDGVSAGNGARARGYFFTPAPRTFREDFTVSLTI